MAYDQNSAYEAPRRHYNNQQAQRQQAPVQQQYQQGYDDYEQAYGRGYAQGGYQPQEQRRAQPQQYDNTQGYGELNPYAQEMNHGNGRNQDYRGHNDGNRQPHRQPQHQQQQQQQYQDQGYAQPQNGYAMQNQYEQRPSNVRPQQERHYEQRPSNEHYQPERQYDSRYQQRPLRNEQSPPQHHASPPQQHASRAQPQAQARYSPQSHPPQAQERYPPQPQPQPQARMHAAPPSRDHDLPAMEAQYVEPKKLTMAEWKAQEKAKMQKDSERPEVLAQDNAFPTFPATGKKKEPSRNGGQSAMSDRVSEDQGRPSTSSSLRPDGSRPGPSRDNSYQRDRLGADQQRPSMEHKPFSFEPQPDRPSLDSQRPPHHQDRIRTPVQQEQVRSQTPPQQDPRRFQRQDAAFDTPSQGMRSPPPGQSQPPPQTRTTDYFEAQRRLPAPQDQQSRPAVYAPQRPPTSDSARGAPRSNQPQQSMSPLGQYSQSVHDPTDSGLNGRLVGQDRSPPRQQQPFHRPQDSGMSDVLDGYYDEGRRPSKPSVAPSRALLSRDEEIEAEMPDFDSAAPGQTSSLYKRNQPAEQPVKAPSTAQHHLAQQKNGHGSHASDSSNGFDFGFAGQGPQHQYEPVDRQQVTSPQTYHELVQSVPHPFANETYGRRSMDDARQVQDRRQPPLRQGQPQFARPIQPPFANQTYERRSMDDARQMQMPHRGPPPGRGPGQQLPQNDYGPLPPPPRPGFDRQATAMTTASDPGQRRMPGGPPLRPGAQQQQPPGPRYGAPLTQQRSAPGPPSAPDPTEQRHSNPDALPAHPVPVRAGLLNGGPAQAPHPAPVRNYNNAPPASNQRPPPSTDTSNNAPVTHAELRQLLASVEANPGSPKTALNYAKKLVEAASVLASDGGRADQKTTAKNRERYLMDAYKRIKKLTSGGYPDAQFYLADCYGQGMLGLEVDPKEAFKLYQAAAKAGHATAAYRTAVCCEMGAEEGGGTGRDLPKAVQWYRRSAALGEVAAMFKVGMIGLKGLLGQPRNLGEAVTWLKRAAERADGNNPHALHELGLLYESANSTNELRHKILPDDAYALSLFRQAADFGYKQSQFRLGQAHEYGHLGLPIDHRASIKWYSKAAAQGEHQAELALSGWYLTGADGILEHSDTEAYLWARKAAQSEPPLAKAMFAMGYFTETGIGCPVNLDEAKRWYGRAASYKHPKALERLEELRRGGKSGKAAPVNGKLTRKDQKRDEAECSVM